MVVLLSFPNTALIMLPPKQKSQEVMKNLHHNWMEAKNFFSLLPCPSSNSTCAQLNTQLAGEGQKEEEKKWLRKVS